MDALKIGGDTVSALDLNASQLQKPDILAGRLRLKESLKAWKQLIADGKVESLMLKIDSPPEVAGVAARMLSEHEQQQLLTTKKNQSKYLQNVLQTPILK